MRERLRAMRGYWSWGFLALFAALASVPLLASSCTVVAASDGNLTLSWTVASTATPAECTTYGASNVVFRLTDPTGNPYGSAISAPCSAFSTSMGGLPAGTYTVTGQMVDVNGQAVSTVVGPVPITVASGATAVQAFDFPAASFTTPAATSGSMVVTWTIASTADPAQCTAHNAASFVVQLMDASGNLYATPFTASCAAFATTIASIPVGTYGVSAYLADANGTPITTTAGPQAVAVTAGNAVTQPFDFQPASFTQ